MTEQTPAEWAVYAAQELTTGGPGWQPHPEAVEAARLDREWDDANRPALPPWEMSYEDRMAHAAARPQHVQKWIIAKAREIEADHEARTTRIGMHVEVTTTVDGEHVDVRSPYDEQFVAAARKLGGRWDADQRRWVFPAAQRDAVIDLARQIHGEE